jgi:glycosyltransferase involved in cell wall biosynthesis
MMAVSVTIPVFNEEAVIEKVLNDCYTEIIEKIPDSELIVVNDGSTDGTFRILERLKQKFRQLKVIHSEKNIGHGQTLRLAFQQAQKRLIFHIDGDNQFSVKDFWRLYKHIEENDIVIGYRSPRHDHLHRKILSLILQWINVILFGVSLRDVNAPFKLIKADALSDIMGDMPQNFSATPMILCIMARLKGYKMIEVPVVHFERKTGKTSMTGFNLMKLCIIFLGDLLKLKYRIINGRLKKP